MKIRPTSILFFLIPGFALLSFFSCRKEIFEKKDKPEVYLRSGDERLNQDEIYLDSDTVYIVTTNLARNTGQKLTIEAGTLIKMNDLLSITINAGARIDANGSADAPIIFTSSATIGAAGQLGNDGSGFHKWYGLRILGDATQPGLSSGVLKFIRIEFAGEDENYLGLPSLLLSHVSEQTTIEHIQVSYSFSTNSFEISGGDCNASYLISYASSGNDFYISNGYTGMLQHIFAYRYPSFPAGIAGANLAGIQIDGASTFPIISNMTILGPDLQIATSFAYKLREPSASLLVTNGAKFKIRNSAFMAFPNGGFYLNDRNSAMALQFGPSEYKYTVTHSSDTSRTFVLPSRVYDPYTSKDLKEFLLNPSFENEIFSELNQFQLRDPFNYNYDINPFPDTTSPLQSGADFNDPAYLDPFFVKVSYRGALGSEDWTKGWVNFKPLQTKYN